MIPARVAPLALLASLAAAPARGASSPPATPPAPAAVLDEAAAGRFAALALDCVHREYPNKLSHVLQGDADARPPRELTPSFFGCFDWHSSVHGHWLLARLARLYPAASFAGPARAALARSLGAENVAAEVSYFRGKGRASFERPYGLAWLLQLAAELRAWDDPEARAWAAALAPLEAEAADRLRGWLPKLRYPVRVGEHAQTAFALGLAWDWAGVAADAPMRALLAERIRSYYLADRACPIAYEPSGEDFLSPCLAEADLLRRVLDPPAFARFLGGFLPGIPRGRSGAWLAPGIVTDRSDPKLAHLDGLNLSRAWMLEGIAHGLPARDGRIPALRAAAARHAGAALPAVTGEHYEGGHWLGSFAVYLTTRAGTSPSEAAPARAPAPVHAPLPGKEAGEPAAPPLTMARVLESARPEEWRPIDPARTLYLELDAGRVVVELAPDFAPRHVANVLALARQGYYDGLAIVRVQDGFVVQWGDPDAGTPGRERSTGAAARSLPAELTRPAAELPFQRLPDPDTYAPETGFSSGFPAARDPSAGRAWLVHCYGTVAVGRDESPDSGGGTELYAVLGHAPRQLDRNTTVVGRVVKGMELLAALPRGAGPMGFHESAAWRVPIRRVRVAADVPPKERTPLEALRTDSSAFAGLVEARRNRREPWYLVPAGRIDVCNVPLPVRPMGAAGK